MGGATLHSPNTSSCRCALLRKATTLPYLTVYLGNGIKRIVGTNHDMTGLDPLNGFMKQLHVWPVFGYYAV